MKRLIIGFVGIGLAVHLICHALKEIPENRVQVRGVCSRACKNLRFLSSPISCIVSSTYPDLF